MKKRIILAAVLCTTLLGGIIGVTGQGTIFPKVCLPILHESFDTHCKVK